MDLSVCVQCISSGRIVYRSRHMWWQSAPLLLFCGILGRQVERHKDLMKMSGAISALPLKVHLWSTVAVARPSCKMTVGNGRIALGGIPCSDAESLTFAPKLTAAAAAAADAS